MPYISTEALVGAAFVVVLALGFQYLPTAESDIAGGANKKNKKNKNKRKGKPTAAAGEVTSSVAPSEVESDAIASKKKGKGKAKKAAVPTPGTKPVAAPVSAPAPQSASEADSEPSPAPSFAAAAGGSTSAPAKPKLLAEKLLPKPRKTKVDDMLAPEDRPPQIARVMKITPANAPPSPAFVSPVEKVSKFEEDYADSTSDSITDEQPPSDDEWNVVSAKKKPMSISIGGGSSRSSSSHANNNPETKLQRKNQKKAEAKKAQRAADEADRLRRLAMHKRDLERQRIDEIYKQKTKVIKQHGKVVSVGSTSSVSETGKLVWD